jgi:hypothetical protein
MTGRLYVCRACGQLSGRRQFCACAGCCVIARSSARGTWAQRARGERIPSMEQRGYGPEPRRLRAEVARVVEAGRALCARCGGSIAPGTRWDLDHSDDRMGYIGPSHVRCNRATAGGRKGQGQEDAARGVVSRLW